MHWPIFKCACAFYVDQKAALKGRVTRCGACHLAIIIMNHVFYQKKKERVSLYIYIYHSITIKLLVN
jgi:hypothetical protein